MPPPSTTASRPGPAAGRSWPCYHRAARRQYSAATRPTPATGTRASRCGLGLDLSSGYQVTLKAVPPKGHTADRRPHEQGHPIMLNRVNGLRHQRRLGPAAGQRRSSSSRCRGKSAKQVGQLVGATAQLAFRQVLLDVAEHGRDPLRRPPARPPVPSAVPSGVGESAVVPSASASPKASAQAPERASGGTRAGRRERSRCAARQPAGQPSAVGSARRRRAPRLRGRQRRPPPTAVGHATTRPTAPGDRVPGQRRPVKLEFNRLNCANKDWQQAIG